MRGKNRYTIQQDAAQRSNWRIDCFRDVTDCLSAASLISRPLSEMDSSCLLTRYFTARPLITYPFPRRFCCCLSSRAKVRACGPNSLPHNVPTETHNFRNSNRLKDHRLIQFAINFIAESPLFL